MTRGTRVMGGMGWQQERRTFEGGKSLLSSPFWDKPTDRNRKAVWLQPDLGDSLRNLQEQIQPQVSTQPTVMSWERNPNNTAVCIWLLPCTVKAAVVSSSPHTQVYSPASFSSVSWISSFTTVPSCLILYLPLALSSLLPFLHST